VGLQGTAVAGTRILTVPNALSLIRLLGVPLFLWLILGPHADGWALVVLMISGFTDWLDGYLARSWGQISRLGQLLDPAVDRLYILAAVLGLTLRDIIPLEFALLLLMRDVVLAFSLPVLQRYGYGPLPVHFLGKAATFCLLYAFPLLLLGDGTGAMHELAYVFGWAFAIWGTALYWWAGLLYLAQVRRLVTSVRRQLAPPESTPNDAST
jgi:cardiolipin synthase (CMP-forming)